MSNTTRTARIAEVLTALHAWRMGNPLKIRQAEQNLSNAEAVSLLGCSSRTYYDWLGGEYVPSDWSEISKFLNETPADVERRWLDWLDVRPRL